MKAYPRKTPLRTPRSWPPWPWFSREKSLISQNSKVLFVKRNLAVLLTSNYITYDSVIAQTVIDMLKIGHQITDRVILVIC
jgi:hypothetical protein